MHSCLESLESRLAVEPHSALHPVSALIGAAEIDSLVRIKSAAVERKPRACCVICLQQPKTPAALALLPALCASSQLDACTDVVCATGTGATAAGLREFLPPSVTV